MSVENNDALRRMSLDLGESRQFCARQDCKTRAKKHDRTLAVNHLGDRVTYHCWHCDDKDAVRLTDRANALPPPPPRKPPQPVSKKDILPLSDDVVEYFRDRGISRAILDWAGIKTSHVRGVVAAAYPYPTENPTGYKVRAIHRDEHGKRATRIIGEVKGLFLQDKLNIALPSIALLAEPLSEALLSSDELSYAEPNIAIHSYVELHARAREDQIIICEGEDDALSCIEAGVANATSVPHGAINPDSKPGSDNAKLAFVSDQPEFWKPFTRIIIATDADGPGQAMMAELARRLGRWRSYLVNWPDGCKDANDVLVLESASALAEAIFGAKAEDVPGLYDADAFKTDLLKLRRGEGASAGVSSGFPSLDHLYRVAPGITVVTGWPKSGKSDFVDQVHMNLARQLGWCIAVWSPENPPAVHIAKLCEKQARKRFFPNMPNQMSDEAFEEAYSFVREHFKFVSLSGGSNTIDAILERFSAAVARFGCKSAVIDPYNYIAKSTEREDDFISEMLNKTKDWALAHEVNVFFIAHPKGEAPAAGGKKKVCNGHSISGGPTWWAKCDFGLTVHREDFHSELHVWAARHAHLGQHGMGELTYHNKTASFEDRDTFFGGGTSVDNQSSTVADADSFD